ncbi:MAG: fused MFS/spermidine synthase [Chloroflexi bacterium]|nr:fused MFS/spermidine synthase [Chloroflexota bacterium]
MGGLWVSLLIVFMASCCTMVLELVAGRILAPFIGVSLYTWTSIIGVCLAGISAGNFLGGVLADKAGSRRTLGLILLGGGLFSLLILPLAAYDLTNIIPKPTTGQASDVWLITRIVVITSVLFLPPTLILGMVSPIVIKLALTDLRQTGSIAGKIYAFSTVGSIVGTFLTGFYLVSAFGTRSVVLGVAVILIGMAFVFGNLLPFGKDKKGNAEVTVATALIVIGLVYWINPRGVITYERPDALNGGCYMETNYFCIKVTGPDLNDEHQTVSLVLDHLIHSYNSLNDPTYLKYGYIKVYADMIEYVAQKYPKYSAFFIGGGGYTLPRQMETLRPDAKIVVSEIDPGVTETNFARLGVRRDTNIITYNADARQIVDLYQGGEKFDLVFGDAFNDLQIPYHLTTKEFAQKVRSMMKDDGLYLALVIDKLRGGLFIPAYTKTVKEVFPYVYILNDAPNWNSSAPNTYLVAASATPIDMDRIRAIKPGQGFNGQPLVQIMPQDVMDTWLAETPTIILTDDYAPADNLVAPLFVERSF